MKEVKLTYHDIESLVVGIPAFLSRELPIDFSIKFTRALRELRNHAEDYSAALQEARKKAVKLSKDGAIKSDDNGNVIWKSDDAREKFEKQHSELRRTEVSVKIEDLPTLQEITDYCKEENIKIRGTIITSLYPLLV